MLEPPAKVLEQRSRLMFLNPRGKYLLIMGIVRFCVASWFLRVEKRPLAGLCFITIHTEPFYLVEKKNDRWIAFVREGRSRRKNQKQMATCLLGRMYLEKKEDKIK